MSRQLTALIVEDSATQAYQLKRILQEAAIESTKLPPVAKKR